jgi:phenylacetate-CoA ligase
LTSPSNWIEWLHRKRPTYLLTFPSVAQELSLHKDAASIAALGIKAIIGISEIVSQSIRDDVRNNLGVEILQIYACAEMGCIAVQETPDGQCLACEENVLLEILDDAGQPVKPGETGRVVLTSLYNYATPFIRYEIGDYATLADEPSPSGNKLMRVKRIDGRRRNSIAAADGRRLWAHDILTLESLRWCSSKLVQVRQRGEADIEVRYVPTAAGSPPDVKNLKGWFESLLGKRINLSVIPVDRLTRSISGKCESVVSEC